jgi:hypothetical protein
VERGVGDHLAQRAFQLAHVRAQLLGDVEGDVLGQHHLRGLGLLQQDRHPHLELGRLDRDGQPLVEAAAQPVVDARELLGVGVAGDDDLLARVGQGLERVEELLLRAVLAAEELDVVDQQQVERVVVALELVEGLALVGAHDVAHVLLGVDVAHARAAVAVDQRVAHRVDQVRLAQAHPAVQEQRVVRAARVLGDLERRGARHLVGLAGDEGLEGEVRVDAGALDVRGVLVGGGRHRARAGGDLVVLGQQRRLQRGELGVVRTAAGGRRVGAAGHRREQRRRRRAVRGRRGLRARRRGRRRLRGGSPGPGARRRELELDADVGIDLADQLLDAPAVLRAHPVELDPVGRAQPQHLAGLVEAQVGDRLDPGLVLLGRELLLQARGACLPDAVHRVRCWREGHPGALQTSGSYRPGPELSTVRRLRGGRND